MWGVQKVTFANKGCRIKVTQENSTYYKSWLHQNWDKVKVGKVNVGYFLRRGGWTAISKAE